MHKNPSVLQTLPIKDGSVDAPLGDVGRMHHGFILPYYRAWQAQTQLRQHEPVYQNANSWNCGCVYVYVT